MKLLQHLCKNSRPVFVWEASGCQPGEVLNFRGTTVTPAGRLIEHHRGWAHHLLRCKARQARTSNLASIVNITSYIHQTTEFAWETSSRGVIKSSVLLLFVFDVTKYYLMLVTKRSRLVNNRSRKIKRPFGSDDRIQQQNNHLSFLPPSLSS